MSWLASRMASSSSLEERGANRAFTSQDGSVPTNSIHLGCVRCNGNFWRGQEPGGTFYLTGVECRGALKIGRNGQSPWLVCKSSGEYHPESSDIFVGLRGRAQGIKEGDGEGVVTKAAEQNTVYTRKTYLLEINSFVHNRKTYLLEINSFVHNRKTYLLEINSFVHNRKTYLLEINRVLYIITKPIC